MTTLIPEEHLPRQISTNSILFWGGNTPDWYIKMQIEKGLIIISR